MGVTGSAAAWRVEDAWAEARRASAGRRPGHQEACGPRRGRDSRGRHGQSGALTDSVGQQEASRDRGAQCGAERDSMGQGETVRGGEATLLRAFHGNAERGSAQPPLL